jgi:uncharacterized protein YjbI with pentapeptide repeats
MSKQIFSVEEKRELIGEIFRDVALAAVDFSHADLRGARFVNASLRDCDFTGADLRSVDFVRCDLRRAVLSDVELGGNRFDGSCLAGAVGLTAAQSSYVRRRGGSFAA